MNATTPMFDFKRLMLAAGAETAEAMGQRLGLNRKGVHNRIVRGIGWAEADNLAIRCGFMPWEIWPEWADVDPAVWSAPVCRHHGNDHVVDNHDLTQYCQACEQEVAIAA